MDETVIFPRETTLAKIRDAIRTIAVAQATQSKQITNWMSIRNVLRQGYGPEAFPIGSQLQYYHETYGDVVADVVAHNYDLHYSGRYPYSMTLLTHGLPFTAQFAGNGALYYCAEQLEPETYHFTLPDFLPQWGGGRTYQFTTAKPVPAGGQIGMPWRYGQQVTAIPISTYATIGDTQAIETLTLTEGEEGIDLGVADGTTPNMNYAHHLRAGTNCWKYSPIRQLLNSDKAKGTFWAPQNRFDRPPSWNAQLDGWMKGLPEDLLEVCAEVDHTVTTNDVYEIDMEPGSPYTVRDKFWLPSTMEIFGGGEATYGVLYPYYRDAINADRIKYMAANDNPNVWFTRTAYEGDANSVYRVGANGTSNHGGADDGYAIAIACAIY